MRFHVLGLTHLPVSATYSACAFTQKIVKMCRMLMAAGHTVFLYGAEGSDAPCSEFVQTHTLEKIRRSFFKRGDSDEGIGYDWKREHFRTDFSNETPASKEFMLKAIEGINKRKQDDDFLLLSMGNAQAPIAQMVKLYLTVESGIGYTGCYAPSFKAFESSAIRNYLYGAWNHAEPGMADGKFYDRVIPNYWDPNDWPLVNDGTPKSHALYVGRFNMRKGVTIAADATRFAGFPLWIAGQGCTVNGTTFKGNDTPEIDGRHMKYLGVLDTKDVNREMANAACVFVPTIYLEPFGGVAVEAMLSGTPVIVSDYAVFPETVIQGVTGFRCNTMQDFVDAVNECRKPGRFDPKVIRKHAEKYLMQNVWPLFEKWFNDLMIVKKAGGFYEVRQDEWKKAQDWEKSWWRDFCRDFGNTYEEEQKQVEYAKRMGLQRAKSVGVWYDSLAGASVLDIGSNAVSLLLKTQGYGKAAVADPMPIPDWAKARYKAAGIDYFEQAAEDLGLPDKSFDEVWIYNVLQHVKDPEAVVRQARRIGKRVRVFEWVEIGVCPGHPHNLHAADLDRWFGVKGQIGEYTPDDGHGCKGKCWYGAFEQEAAK